MTTSSYAKVRKALAEQHESGGDTQPRCIVCGDKAPWNILSLLGARCSTCYGRYLREPRQHAALPNVSRSGSK